MSDFDWSMRMSFDGVNYEYSWQESFYKDKSMGYYGIITNIDTGENLHGSSQEWIEQAISHAASVFRQTQLRNEKTETRRSLSLAHDVSEKILKFYERSTTGEYLGQRSNNELFYVQDVASLLDMPMQYVLKTIDEMIKTGKIGLNGMILIPYEQYAETFRQLEKSTGHKQISISDFGWWSCVACGQNGDDYTNPKDYKCETLVEKITG